MAAFTTTLLNEELDLNMLNLRCITLHYDTNVPMTADHVIMSTLYFTVANYRTKVLITFQVVFLKAGMM